MAVGQMFARGFFRRVRNEDAINHDGGPPQKAAFFYFVSIFFTNDPIGSLCVIIQTV